MEILASRVIVESADLERSRRFYEDTLGLRIAREYGVEGRVTGVVYFLGGGFLEVTGGRREGADASGVALWLQVPDLAAEARRLTAAGVSVSKPAGRMPWGLDEMWIGSPDGIELRLIEIPPEHPLRRRVD